MVRPLMNLIFDNSVSRALDQLILGITSTIYKHGYLKSGQSLVWTDLEIDSTSESQIPVLEVYEALDS